MILAAACGSSPATDSSSAGPNRFPDVTLDNLRDRDEKLSFDDVAGGRPAVVNFFASWCAPCKRELPVFVAAAEEHGDKVAFIGVDTEDSASEGLEMLERYDIEYPALYDPDAAIRNALGRAGLPITVFVAADGTVNKIVAREIDAEELDTEIAALAGES